MLEVVSKLVDDAPLPLATRSDTKILDLNEDKAKANIAAHGVIVNLAGGTLHEQFIEKGNIYVCVSSS